MRTKLTLRAIAIVYLAAIILLPVGMVAWRTFEHGIGAPLEALSDPDAISAIWLTLLIVVIAVPINTVFGILCAIVLVRHSFRGKGLLNAAIDLPLGISPVVVGLSLIIVYGRNGWIGSWLMENGIQVIFSTPGMVIATMFVSLPFVVREVVPVLREIGTEQEQAAETLGAGSWQTFRLVTLPAIRAGVGYGVILTIARSIGEFGAVAIVSGKIIGRTTTMTLYVEEQFQGFNLTAAYTISVVMALLALGTLVAMNLLERKES
jgi:sulfate/thiosulfate transport system permease protein